MDDTMKEIEKYIHILEWDTSHMTNLKIRRKKEQELDEYRKNLAMMKDYAEA